MQVHYNANIVHWGNIIEAHCVELQRFNACLLTT